MRTRSKTVPITAPAAGADFSFTPSQTDRVYLLTVTANLLADANVATRIPALTFKTQQGLQFCSMGNIISLAASQQATWNWARGVGTAANSAYASGEQVAVGLPDMWLEPGDTVSAVTINKQVGDKWSNIVWRGLVGDWWQHEEGIAAFARLMAAIRG